jgi:thiol-disulfide isomerase/thioredoxin
MKKLLIYSIALFALINANGQKFQITLNAPQFKTGIAYLTFANGSNFNVEDSAAFGKGMAVFKGNKKLPGGVYTIFFPGKRLRSDFLVDKEQIISIKADTTDLLNKFTVSGSKENIPFAQYQKFTAEKGKFIEKERAAYTHSVTKADSLLHEKNYNQYQKELTDYRNSIIKNQPNSMLAMLLNAMKEPEVPVKKPLTQSDSLINYNYYKQHYWDGISFMDDRVIRTPFFMPKLERYYREVMIQAPDSLIKDIDYKLLLARNSPEMYKLMLNWLTDEYINPKYMGQDAVFVHLFEKYHSTGLTSWLNAKQMETINRRAYMLMSNLIGEKAANLEMIDTAGIPAPLYGVEADYTVVAFWDPNCGHCKTEIPRIDSIYRASWKKHNLKIYAVLSEDAKADWIKYINDNKLTDWIHVRQTKEMEQADYAAQKAGFRQLYDVTLTPKLFLLDKDKRIIAKGLGFQQMNDLLELKWKAK